MRTGVHYAIVGVFVGQIVVFFAAVKGKFEHLHARIAGLLHQLGHVGSQGAQVLRDDLKLAALLFHLAEELDARTLDPFAVDGVFSRIRNGVVARKRAEVVDTGDVIKLGRSLDALKPPLVVGLLEIIPVVERIAPELTGSREIIRRTACHRDGIAVVIELEDLGICPGVGAVHSDINRHIAQDLDAQTVDIGAERLPLLIKLELQELPKNDLVAQLILVAFQSVLLAHFDVLGPLCPGRHVVVILHCHKQGVVFEPFAVLVHKIAERLLFRALGLLL